jgi:lysine/ornithine N-monooxygenase
MVIIIGAGPAGLATAYYLQRHGIACKILEQFEVGSSWARFYEHVKLHSLKEHSALPGLPMPKDYPKFPSGRKVYDYLQSYARHFNFDIQTNTKVLRARYYGGWQLKTSQGLITGSQLVLATGIFNAPRMPEIEGLESFTGQIIHSQQYKRPEDFLNKKVLVIGVGNSGAEIAVALANAGVPTDVALRDGVLFVPYPRSPFWFSLGYWSLRAFPKPLSNIVMARTQKNFADLGLPLPAKEPVKRYPVVGFDLVQLVKDKKIRVRPAIARVTVDSVEFASGECEKYDTIICATGFYRQTPIIFSDRDRVRNLPNLYHVGIHYPTTEPFLLALKREARQLAKQIAESTKATSPPKV